jgi:hypothetical protein
VTSVTLPSLNRQRANIVLSHLVSVGEVLDPAQVARRERVFERDGVLRWDVDDGEGGQVFGRCRVGVSMDVLLRALSRSGSRALLESGVGLKNATTGSRRLRGVTMGELVRLFEGQGYLLWVDFDEGGSGGSARRRTEVLVVLKGGCSPLDQIKAWGQALLLARRFSCARQRAVGEGEKHVRSQRSSKDEDEDALDREDGRRIVAEIRFTLDEVSRLFDRFAGDLRRAGWDLDVAALETRTGVRAEINGGKVQ